MRQHRGARPPMTRMQRPASRSATFPSPVSRGIFSGYDPGVETPPLFGDEPIFWLDVDIDADSDDEGKDEE